jgi:hypothetical protein
MICLAICISGCEYGGPENLQRFDDAVLQGAWVVKVTVESLGVFTNGPHKGVPRATISIDEVLFGPPEIKGKTLDVPIYQKGNAGALILDTPLNVGERGIWLVYLTDGRLEVDVRGMYFALGVHTRLPARKIISVADYEAAIEWAKDVAAVNAAAPGERNDLLVRLSGSNNDRTAAWAKESLRVLKEESEKILK